MPNATGTFTVRLDAVDTSALGQQAGLGRMSIDKIFEGGFEGVSQGEMLTEATAETGSMSYVALERCRGSLIGRSGSFVLMHTASMIGDDVIMIVRVVPNSGTEQLTGLSGEMTVKIVAGVHTYHFAYQIGRT